MEYFTNYEKISQLLLLNIYTEEKHLMHLILFQNMPELMKYELEPKEKLDVY